MTLKWWHLGIVAASLLASFVAGRGSVHQTGTISISPAPTLRDGGVPEASSTVAVGTGSATTTVTCKVEPPAPPKVVYVKVHGTDQEVYCPQLSCPTVVCSGTATSETPPVHAQTDVPLLPPTVVTVRETAERRIWGIGPSVLCAAGACRPGAAGKWAPLSWLELHAAGSTNGAEADILIDF